MQNLHWFNVVLWRSNKYSLLAQNFSKLIKT